MNFNGIVPSQTTKAEDLNVFTLKNTVRVTFCSYIFSSRNYIKQRNTGVLTLISFINTSKRGMGRKYSEASLASHKMK